MIIMQELNLVANPHKKTKEIFTMGVYHQIQKIEGYTRGQVISYIRTKLLNNEDWRIQALNLLFDMQTKREKYNYMSHGHNNVGFNKNDSLKLTTIARLVQKNTPLTDDQKRYLKIKIPRYATQVARFSDEKILKTNLDKYFSFLKKPNEKIFKTDDVKIKETKEEFNIK